MNANVQEAMRKSAQEAHDEAMDAMRQVECARGELRSAEEEADVLRAKREALLEAVRQFDRNWTPSNR